MMELGVLSKHNNNIKKIQMNWIIHQQRKIVQKTLREQSPKKGLVIIF
jgi:hypothetical protein